jgi:U3 small nucleolar RNA-associated protein 14
MCNFSFQAKDNVQEMVKKNKELTEKLTVESDSDSESERVKDKPAEDKEKMTTFSPWTGSSLSGANPWMEPVKAKMMTTYKRPEAVVNKEAEVESEEEVVDSVSVPIDMEMADRERKLKMETLCSDEESEDSVADLPVVEQWTSDTKEVVILSDPDSDVVEIISERDLDELFGILERRKRGHEKERKTDNEKPAKKRKRNKKQKHVKKVEESKRKRNKKQKHVEEVEESDEDDNDNDQILETIQIQDDGEELMTVSLQRKQTLEELGEWSDSVGGDAKRPRVESNPVSTCDDNTKSTDSPENKDISIDPKLVLTVETKIKNSLAPTVVSDEQRMTISEAFIDDDVMEEFSKEKRAVVDREKPKDLDLTLPGWGEWGGVGIVVSKKKKKR